MSTEYEYNSGVVHNPIPNPIPIRNPHPNQVCTEYEYDSEQYVWPHVGELQDRRRSHDSIPAERRTVLKAPCPSPAPLRVPLLPSSLGSKG